MDRARKQEIEVEIVISEGGWVVLTGSPSEMEGLVEALGEEEFDEASGFCG
jgi:hypothetical protein